MVRALVPRTTPLCAILALLFTYGISGTSFADPSTRPDMIGAPFGQTESGAAVELYTLRNRDGMQVRITNYGGIVTSLMAPDRTGRFADVVLGCDTLACYL